MSGYGRDESAPTPDGVFVAHFTATRRIPPTLCVLKETSMRCKSDVERLHFTTHLISSLRSL